MQQVIKTETGSQKAEHEAQLNRAISVLWRECPDNGTRSVQDAKFEFNGYCEHDKQTLKNARKYLDDLKSGTILIKGARIDEKTRQEDEAKYARWSTIVNDYECEDSTIATLVSRLNAGCEKDRNTLRELDEFLRKDPQRDQKFRKTYSQLFATFKQRCEPTSTSSPPPPVTPAQPPTDHSSNPNPCVKPDPNHYLPGFCPTPAHADIVTPFPVNPLPPPVLPPPAMVDHNAPTVTIPPAHQPKARPQVTITDSWNTEPKPHVNIYPPQHDKPVQPHINIYTPQHEKPAQPQVEPRTHVNLSAPGIQQPKHEQPRSHINVYIPVDKGTKSTSSSSHSSSHVSLSKPSTSVVHINRQSSRRR
jgi:hypothetical protein